MLNEQLLYGWTLGLKSLGENTFMGNKVVLILCI